MAQGKSHLGQKKKDKRDDGNQQKPGGGDDQKKDDDNPGCKNSGQCSVATGTVIVGVILWYAPPPSSSQFPMGFANSNVMTASSS